MTYTAEQLTVMADDGLNAVLATIQGEYRKPPDGAAVEVIGGVLNYRNKYGTYIACHKSYCADIEYTMSLAFDHKIGIEFIDGFGWTASHAYNLASASCYDDPIRAVVMCLILYLQERGRL